MNILQTCTVSETLHRPLFSLYFRGRQPWMGLRGLPRPRRKGDGAQRAGGREALTLRVFFNLDGSVIPRVCQQPGSAPAILNPLLTATSEPEAAFFRSV